jgi:hypothetical protein
MKMSSSERVILAIALLLRRGSVTYSTLAAGTGLSPTQVTRKQNAKSKWDLDELDLVAAFFGVATVDLVAGPEAAAAAMPAPAADAAHQPSLEAGTDVPAAAPVLEPATSPAPAATPAEAVDAPSPAPVTNVPQYADPDRDAAGDLVQGPSEPCTICGQNTPYRAAGQPQHLGGFCLPGSLAPNGPAVQPEPEPAPHENGSQGQPPQRTAASARVNRSDRESISHAELAGMIHRRVEEELTEHGGDTEAAIKSLEGRAIEDVMALWKRSRVGTRYEPTFHFRGPDILVKPSQQDPDKVWEGRPFWTNPQIKERLKKGEGPFDVVTLDANAAYLSAFKSHLPIGALQHDTSGIYNPKQAGVYLITPPQWEHTDLPSPLGNRREPGKLWVTVSTLRLLLRVSTKLKLCEPPVIHEAYVSGSTEALLEKTRVVLADERAAAIARDDSIGAVTVEYIKAMYSKFISTCGESNYNRELHRVDWMHIFRAQAFANHWLKAHKAREAGLTVVTVKGTDELHVIGDWRAVFSEGRAITDMKNKGNYVLGSK